MSSPEKTRFNSCNETFFATVKGTKYEKQRNESKLIKGFIDCGKLGKQNGIFYVLLKIIIKNLLKQSVRRTRQNDEVKRQIWFLLCPV